MAQKASMSAILTTAVFVGVGVSIGRGDLSGYPLWQWPLLIGAALLACVVWFGAIHLLLMQWDRFWALLKRKFSAGSR